LPKDCFACVPEEHSKQETSNEATSQVEKLLEPIKQLQHEIDNSRQTEARLERQITDLMAPDEQPSPPVTKCKQTAEHRKQQTDEKLVANAPTDRGRQKPQRKTKHNDSHHAYDGKARQKLCRKCKKQKPEGDFHKDRSCKDGLARWCKECKAKAARKRRKKQMALKK
jgi:hypothetical protein